jgi:hypothetical protein
MVVLQEVADAILMHNSVSLLQGSRLEKWRYVHRDQLRYATDQKQWSPGHSVH